MTTIEHKFDALAAFILAEDPETKETARRALVAVMKAPTAETVDMTADEEDIVHNFLAEIGAQPSLIGYKMMVYAIMEEAKHPGAIDNLCRVFYPAIALKFNTKPDRVERALRHLIDTCWQFGDIDTLHRYFGQYIREGKDRPTNSSFIARSGIICRSKFKKLK